MSLVIKDVQDKHKLHILYMKGRKQNHAWYFLDKNKMAEFETNVRKAAMSEKLVIFERATTLLFDEYVGKGIEAAMFKPLEPKGEVPKIVNSETVKH